MNETWRAAELESNRSNGRVGSKLVSESDNVRVWMINLKPGERIPYHCHVLNYFWTATSEGSAKSHYSDGRSSETSYRTGDTRHYVFGKGESMIHDLENTGSTALTFVTAELKVGSANAPLDIT